MQELEGSLTIMAHEAVSSVALARGPKYRTWALWLQLEADKLKAKHERGL